MIRRTLIACSAGLIGAATSGSGAGAATNPTLQVGIWQRFGDTPASDVLQVSAPQGSQLTLQFNNANGEPQTVKTPKVVIGIVNQALATPETVQRLILSSHRSFESAEASAKHWESLGMQTEIAQPDEWQVWAERASYPPEQFPAIVQYARANQIPGVRIFQQSRSATPLLSWEVNGSRYSQTNLQIFSDAGYFRTNTRAYAGSLTLQPNAYGTYTVVNNVPIETYLRGVVPHEIGPGAPPAAIAAQAVLARTYALKNRHRFVTDNYQLCANTHCQVYKGLTDTLPAADAAIAQTAGQVVTFNNQLIDAVYFSTSGGVTAAFEDVWDGEARPYLQPVMDAVQQPAVDLSQRVSFRQFLARTTGFNEVGISKLFRWRVPISLDKLSGQLKQAKTYLGVNLPPFQRIVDMAVTSRSRSGRVLSMKFDLATDSGVQAVQLNKDNVQLALPQLYSTMFDLDPIVQNGQKTGYTFVGAGFGHGVGLSQYGSYGLARQGFNYAQILNFYYPGTTLTPLTAELAQVPGPRVN